MTNKNSSIVVENKKSKKVTETPIVESAPVQTETKTKKSKKVAETPAIETAPATVEAKTKKSKKTVETPAIETAPAPTETKTKKSKKVVETQVVESAPVQTETKTKKSKKVVETPVVETAPVVESTPIQTETKTKKSKKVIETPVEDVQVVEEDGVEEDNYVKLRYFKLMHNNTIGGRYCGKKPKQAANKAFSSIIKENKKNGVSVDNEIAFSIKECTRNSKHKEYNYIGVRKTLENPIVVPIVNKDGTEKVIEYKFQNKLHKAKAVVVEDFEPPHVNRD